MAPAEFDELGIRFACPDDWEVEVTDDGSRTTVSVQAPDGLAFAMITLDAGRPDPAELADEAQEAMREEYPGLDAVPARETLDGHPAVGHDLEFLTLDMVASCAIRAWRTPRRTVLVFAQWSDLADASSESALRRLIRSLEETDA